MMYSYIVRLCMVWGVKHVETYKEKEKYFS